MNRPLRLWLVAPGMMLYQLMLALFVSGGRLSRLVYWDATWYRDIAIYGYYVQFPLTHEAAGGSNIAFFPAFPLWTKAVLLALPVTPDIAVLLASWLSAIAMWAYFALLLKRLGVDAVWSWIAIFAFAVQPGAFYAIAGYSEPLFTAALLGYVFWSTRALENPRHRLLNFALAAVHGAALSSTRILGVALAAFPFILAVTRGLPRPRLRELVAPLALSITALSGVAAFLVYCSIRWGQWDVYWEANRVGWNVFFDPWKLLSATYYTDVFFTGNLSEVLGRIFTLASLAATVALTHSAWKKAGRDALTLALGLLNLGLIAETVVGSHGMHSMVRYLIPIHALLLPVAALWAQERGKAGLAQWPGLGLKVAGVLVAAWLLAIQVMFIIRYSRNEWVS